MTRWYADHNPLNERDNAIVLVAYGNKIKTQWNLAGKWRLEDIH